MEFWPTDFRTNISSASAKKKRKGKATYANEQWLEFGSLGAATLISRGGPLEWTTTVQPRRKHTLRVVGKTLEVFPPTKPPPLSLPRLSIHKRAEHGAHFLRTRHPDVYIPTGLIRDEIQLDEDEAAAYSLLDPYAGNGLTNSVFENERKQNMHFLAFPSGETLSDLNLSPFLATRNEHVVLSPIAIPALSFDTPIQQVAAISPRIGICRGSSLLAVRTHSTVSIVDVRESAVSQREQAALTATTVMPISLSDAGGQRVVDVSGLRVLHSCAEVLFVNEFGAVYNCDVEGGAKTMVIAPTAGENDSFQPDMFWRVVRKDVNTGIRSSSKRAQLFDMRDPVSVVLFDLKDETFLTSIEAPLEGHHLMCLSTTDRLVWVDERKPRKPVLSLKHRRAFDRTLRAKTVDYGFSPLTMLSSSSNPLVTIYDVNYGSSGHIHLYGEPSMFTGSPSMASPLAGATSFRHSAEDGPVFNLFQLSSRGSLWGTKIALLEDLDSSMLQESPQHFEWNADVRTLAATSKAMSGEISPLEEREHKVVNLREAYEKIFQIHQPASESTERDVEAVYQTLEKMPSFWQDMDYPADHMLLPFDIAFRSGPEPSHVSRADFLTQSKLSSPQGFATLIQEKLPISQLNSTVQWHHDLASLPSQMIPDVTTKPRAKIDELREEALGHAATAEGMKRAIEAAQHVALDLALSRYVYSPQSFSTKGIIAPSSEAEDPSSLSQATQAMSLGVTEPAPVRFGFLRPIIREYPEGQRTESDDEANKVGPELPLGVRLLLSQWEVGADPQKFVYNNPYGKSGTSSTLRKPPLAKRTGPSGGQVQQQSVVPPVISMQRVPPVVATTFRSPKGTRLPVRTNSMFELRPRLISDVNVRPASSQENHGMSGDAFSSQDQGPSTQPLSGIFGGRSKQQKKAGKKRMGGF